MNLKIFFLLSCVISAVVILVLYHSDSVEINSYTMYRKMKFLNPSILIETKQHNIFNETYQEFEYILNPGYKICNKSKELLLLAFIPSDVKNSRSRTVIRNTWASKLKMDNEKMKVVFMLGKSQNETINEMLKQEMKIHGDIVQENFIDSYRNLTLKTLMGLRWSSTYCSNAKFILKIDDDVILNSKYLLKYLDYNRNITKSFLCYYLQNTTVNRDNQSKWYLSYDEYKSDIFPSYCQGSAYILTNDIASNFVYLSFKIKRIFLEDAYLGILAKHLGINFIDIYDRYLPDKGYVYDDLRQNNLEDFFFLYVSDEIDYFSIWNHFFL